MNEVVQDRVAAEVVKTIAMQVNVPPTEVNLGMELRQDLGCDSLDLVELTMTVEDEFGIEIDDEQMFALKTVQEMVDCVRSKIS